MTIKKSVFIFFAMAGFAGLLIAGFSDDNEKTKNTPPSTNGFKEQYGIYAIDIPEQIIFAGEKIPVDNFDTRESLDKELLINTYWQSQTVLFIKRANRYFPTIEKIFTEVGVPTDLKYLALTESGLENVVSPAGAKGFWQFLRGTAGDYNLEVNDEIDERYHLEKSSRAAAEFLLDSYEKFGSWTLAAASYNMGRRNTSRQMERQKAGNYFDLVLSEETSRYVFRIIAIKLILESPEKFGFYIDDKDKYHEIPYRLVKVDSTINSLPNFARKQGINYKVLKELNPWLRENTLTNRYGKTYEIKIADTKKRTFEPNPDFFPEDTLLINN